MNTEQKLENHCENYWARRAVCSDGNAGSIVQNLRRWIYAELKDLPCNSTILDVRCGDASFTRLLAKYSAGVTALDSSVGQVVQNAKLYPEITFFQHYMADPLPFMDGTFNVIWCTGVLEQVPNPGLALREMYRGLTPGGRLLVAIPWANNRIRNLPISPFKWPQHFLSANSHRPFFNKSLLEKMANDAGFTSVCLKVCRPDDSLGHRCPPAHLLLEAEKSRLAPFTVSFSPFRRKQPQVGSLMAVPSLQAAAGHTA